MQFNVQIMYYATSKIQKCALHIVSEYAVFNALYIPVYN